MNHELTTTTYAERANVMNREARRALIQQAGAALDQARQSADGIWGLELAALNAMREAGRAFNAASGHEQMVFTLEGNEFVRREILPHLPAHYTLEHVKAAVRIAKVLPKPLQTREDLRTAKAYLQLFFEAFALADAPRREGMQLAHTPNLFAEFVNAAAGMRCMFDKLEAEAPMATWPVDRLDEFLFSAAPVKARIEQAEQLRRAKR